MNNSVKTNSVKATIKNAKKVVNRTPLTKAQKLAQAKKRALNPQFANVQSARRRTEKNAYKTSAKLCLLEVKRTAKLDNVNTKSHENIAYQNECKKAINFLLKNEDKFLPLLSEAVGKIKGNFNVYRFEQLIQKIVKMQSDKGLNFETSLKAIISAKLVNA
tara:strand:- start:64 stop:546 length:483 start_codon:yes stop_codon:yes gene_type:complete